ncbi:MAG: dethiobiotin synthase [Planctomycetota bacterium]
MRDRLSLRCPGLFVTGTDTEVGKTVISCAIARALRLTPVVDRGAREPRLARVGVSKPIASGCRREREGLVNEDAEALAHFADTDQPLDVVNPVRFRPPVAPAEAERMEGVSVDWSAIQRSLETVDAASDVIVLEGAGGVMAPLSEGRGGGGSGAGVVPTDRGVVTVLDLMAWVGYPAVVVARAGLGTINHTAMTVALIQQRGLRVAGVVMNGYVGDEAKQEDASMSTNRAWIERMTGVSVLATVPRVEGKVDPSRGLIDDAVLEAVAIGGPASWLGRASS